MNVDNLSELLYRDMIEIERNALLKAIQERSGSCPHDWTNVDASMSVMFGILLDLHRSELKAFMMAMDCIEKDGGLRVTPDIRKELDKLPILGVQGAAVATILMAHLRIAEEGQRMNTAHLHIDKIARVAQEIDKEMAVGVVDKDGLHVREGGSDG